MRQLAARDCERFLPEEDETEDDPSHRVRQISLGLSPTEIWYGVSDELAFRELRSRYCGEIADVEPAWLIVLDLLKARIQGKSVSITSACLASRRSPTTALRYIEKLVEIGWCVRTKDYADGRRSFLELGAPAMKALEKYMRAKRQYLRNFVRR